MGRGLQILSRRSKNNPVLIGEPGVGKTAISEALAQRIVANDVPAALMGRKLMSLVRQHAARGASSSPPHTAHIPRPLVMSGSVQMVF